MKDLVNGNHVAQDKTAGAMDSSHSPNGMPKSGVGAHAPGSPKTQVIDLESGESRTEPAPRIESDAGQQPLGLLLIEDDPIIVELLQDTLRAAGYTVRVARHATEAVELFAKHAPETFCVLLDYGIPGMHASRLLERLTEIDGEVKVILSSGYPQNFIVEDFPLERISGFMAKPYDPQVLVVELKTLLRETSGLPSNSAQSPTKKSPLRAK